MSETEAVAAEHVAEEHHPAPAAYVKVALVLAVVTAIEVGAYYVTGLSDAVLSVSLLVMMVVKFALVGLWFMHLRFDSRIFRRLFIAGIVLALLVYTVAMTTLGLLVGK
ncbi:MAG: cytochrome C oxidase subunit IV family protein [Actinomycetota bacterium]